MKRILLSFFTAVLVACGAAPKTDYANEPGNKSALEKIRLEPKVKEAIITEANVLYIAVDDDGTVRDGLAGYFCEILREENASCKWVKITQFGTAGEKNGYGVVIGEAKCK